MRRKANGLGDISQHGNNNHHHLHNYHLRYHHHHHYHYLYHLFSILDHL